MKRIAIIPLMVLALLLLPGAAIKKFASLSKSYPNSLGVVDITEPHQGLIWHFDANDPMETQSTWTCKSGGGDNSTCTGEQSPNDCCTGAGTGYCQSMACGYGYNHSADGDMGGAAEEPQENYMNFVFENHINRSGTVGYRQQIKSSFRAAKTSCTLNPNGGGTWNGTSYIEFERAGVHVGYGIVTGYAANVLEWVSVGGGPVQNGDTANEVTSAGVDLGDANGTCTLVEDVTEADTKVQWLSATQYPDDDAASIELRGKGSAGKYNFLAWGPTDEVVMQCSTALVPTRSGTVHICGALQVSDGIEIADTDRSDYCTFLHAAGGGDLDITCTNTTKIESDTPIKAKMVHQIGAAPDATCIAGEIFIDTDETDDTNCTTTSDNSLCLCVATDTWVELDNN